MPAEALELPEGWIKVSEDGHLIKKIETEGTGDSNPGNGAKVEVHYTGRLVSNGEKFDSSVDRGEPFSFKLGAGQVIKGWDVGVKTMKMGEKSIFRMASDYGYGENGSGAKIPGGADLEFDIELLDWNSKEDITAGKKEIMKEVITAGSGYKKPSDCSKVSIALKVMHGDRVVEEFSENEPLRFTVGEESVQGGIEKAVQSMCLNENAKFDVNPKWGYGSEGNAEKGIPADAPLKYEIKLLSLEKEKETYEMDTKEKIEHAKTKKEQGNQFFKAGKLSVACKRYEAGLNAVKYSDSWEDNDKKEAADLQTVLNLNIAVVKSKLKAWKDVKKHAEEALKLQPQNIKALYRKGIALSGLDDWNEAELVFKKGLEQDPENKDFKRELLRLQKKIKMQNEKDRKMYQRMFQ
mmetsp:Transcript_102501/g.153628  ORF Transcript_102501/g.153628 Transcript_102501/m.153628 type:complete len:407 (+) Transcript_102501:31-1251(+)